MINKILRTRFCFLIILLFVFMVFFTACNTSPKKPQEEQGGNKPPEVPEVLVEMESEILETMYDIDAIKGIEMAIEEKEKEELPTTPQAAEIEVETEGELEPEVNVQQPQQEKAGNGQKLRMAIEEEQIIVPLLKEEEIEGTTAEMSEPPEAIDEVWFEIGHKIESFHKKWNVLEADLRDVHAPQDQIDKFEETLIEASEAMMQKDVVSSLFALNNLTSYLANFRNSFTSKVPGPVYKMKYHIRQSVLYAHEEKYENAQEHIDKAKELKNGMQQQLAEKDAQHTAEKFDLSIADLEKQIAAENFDLIQTNAAVVIKNIILIQDTFKGSMK
ncbi:hypothetical protein SAMN05446037_100442 [Anaerovirgula multivorans]|uniref:Uncharacterized protein n=1 Tax=Anaerovirgula multivorans TaxID=312168 RepID=A0A239BPM2_9FIRM|nr:hypothetical protein [Anaerovirgula multivorans]SNS09612.1 hypothetical protein SAMN05446037_100442 [Anaerovirgula multivorans]